MRFTAICFGEGQMPIRTFSHERSNGKWAEVGRLIGLNTCVARLVELCLNPSEVEIRITSERFPINRNDGPPARACTDRRAILRQPEGGLSPLIWRRMGAFSRKC